MEKFIEAIDGRFWRSDAFLSYDRDAAGRVIAHRLDPNGETSSVAFCPYEWKCPEDMGTLTFPASPGHFAVLGSSADSERWQPRLLAVLGWVFGYVGACPITQDYMTARNPMPILFPDGHVESENGDERFDNLSAYIDYRRKPLIGA